MCSVVSNESTPFKAPVSWYNHDIESPSEFGSEQANALPPWAVVRHERAEVTEERNVEAPVAFHQPPVLRFRDENVNGEGGHRNE